MSLDKWLTDKTSMAMGSIDLGLERSFTVAKKLDLIYWDIPVVVVAGTNGKGSVLATLESVYQAAGYRCLLYTSPHIHRFNERIRIDGEEINDDAFMEAVADIEAVRGNTVLTFFEWATLAALQVAKNTKPDVLLLEIGLGGRLDAVNIVESDLAIVTSIDFDHMEYLGNTREAIAREKAGIFRPAKPAICGDSNPPEAIYEKALELSCSLSCYGGDYALTIEGDSWQWRNKSGEHFSGSASLQLKSENIATALQAVCLLKNRLPVTDDQVEQTINSVKLAGRVERKTLAGHVCILDVAHNPQSVAHLAQSLQEPYAGKTWAIYSVLETKDITAMLPPILGVVDHWLVPELDDARAMPGLELEKKFVAIGVQEVDYFTSPLAAVDAFIKLAAAEDRCVIFGSFVTVAVVQQEMENYKYENHA